MTFFDLIRVLLRRWRIVIPVGLLGMSMTLWVASGVGAEYESFASVVFLPAAVNYDEINGELQAEEVNPYYFAGVTRTLATTVPIAVGSPSTRQQALDQGLSPTYELELDFNEPILYVSAKAPTPEMSWDTLDWVLIEITREVELRQGADSDTPTVERATAELLSEVRAIEDTSASVKVLGTLSVATILVTMMAGFAAEGRAQRKLMADEYEFTSAR